MANKKGKNPIAKIDIVSGTVAGLVIGITGAAVTGCQGIEQAAVLGLSLIVCLLISVIKPYKAITKKLFNNEKVEIDENDHIGRIITAALASAFCAVVVSIVTSSTMVAVRNETIDTIVEAYDEQIESAKEQIDMISSENEKVYQDFCFVSDLVDKNKEEINGYDNRIKELDTQKQGFADEITVLNAEINKITEKMEERKNDEGAKVDEWRSEQNSKIEELTVQITALESGIAETDSRIAELDLKKSTANQILDTNSASMEEKWTVYSHKLAAIQALQDNIDSLSSSQLDYYYSKLTFGGLFTKTIVACFVAGLIAIAGVIYLRDPVTEKMEEIKVAREEALKKQREEEEEKKKKEEKAEKEAEEAVSVDLKERRQQNLTAVQANAEQSADNNEV